MIDSCVDYSTRAIPIVPFVDASFHKLVFSPILPPHSHVILHAGLARSCRIDTLKSEKNLHPWGELPVRADGGYEKMFLSVPQPMSATVSTLFEGEGNLMNDGFCDFAFGFAQNDRVGSILRRVKVLGIEKLIIERNQTYQPKRELVLCV